MATWNKKQEHGKEIYVTLIKNDYSSVEYKIIEISSTEFHLWIRWTNDNNVYRVGIFKSLSTAKKNAGPQYGESPR